MPNNVIRDKSRCAICLSDKSRFSKQRPNKKPNKKYNKKSSCNNINPKGFVY